MKHLDEFVVMFFMPVTRQKLVSDEKGNSQAVTYFRMNFATKDGKVTGQVSNATNLSGEAGKVRYIEEGQEKPDGGTVAKSCFSLVGSDSAENIAKAKESIDAFEVAIGA